MQHSCSHTCQHVDETNVGQWNLYTKIDKYNLQSYNEKHDDSVFLVKPTDAEYLNDQEQIIIQLTGIVDVQRRKNATVIFYLPANYNFLYITIFATIGLFLLIYFVAFRIMCKHSDIYDHLALEHLLLLEARTEREIAERGNNEQRYQTSEREENVKSTSGDEYERSRSTIEVIETLN
ncbi:unnamed protein product, partial [Rotaria sp. Silwood1]